MTDNGSNLELYRRLIEISRDLASTLDLDLLLNRIIEAARDISGSEAASILLYDDAGKQLYFQAATNMDPLMRGISVPMDSIAGWIVTNRQAVRISDVNKDQRYFKTVAKTVSFATQSIMGVPLITKDKVVGVLEVLNKQQGEFSEADESLLTVLGAQAAVAIENTRLFQQSDLIAEFVHELRNPLASINTASYLLLRPEISPEQAHQIVLNIQSETMRLTTLTSSFLDLARLESGRVQFHKSSFSLVQMLQECVSVMQAKIDESRISIRIEIPNDTPDIQADRDKLKQVALNLISNAIKYNRPGGQIIIKARLAESEWELFFVDTGMGIPDDELPHMFEKFYRVRASEKITGTGLGLSICKGIIQGHGGRIAVQSKLGQGTQFSISLPRN
ncbi:MAG: GAF domain-containing sensor histidine kinase [Anaerolineae bacterium]|nr:GAF domain-containing sensor histidine kinase [Anaerolineae bacterium]